MKLVLEAIALGGLSWLGGAMIVPSSLSSQNSRANLYQIYDPDDGLFVECKEISYNPHSYTQGNEKYFDLIIGDDSYEFEYLVPNPYHDTLASLFGVGEFIDGECSISGHFYENIDDSGRQRLPGPCLIVNRGERANIRLLNKIEDVGDYHCQMNEDGGEPTDCSDDFLLLSGAGWGNPSHTNLHTHGLHVSPTEPGDDPKVLVKSRGNYSYTFDIPHDHMGGLHW